MEEVCKFVWERTLDCEILMSLAVRRKEIGKQAQIHSFSS